MRISPQQLFEKARKKKYAIGAFNTFNLETTLAILRAGIKKKLPLIIQVTEKTLEYTNFELPQIIKSLIKKIEIPVILHLDHGKNLSIISQCINLGFDSVMIDGSSLDFEKNISLTKKAVALAHKHGVWTEGELGAISSKIEEKNLMTDPEKANEFVKRTGIDALAPSLGSLHGSYKGEEKLDLERLKLIREKTGKTILVLHGASGLPEKDIKQAIKLGISKINIQTDILEIFSKKLRKTFKENSQEYDIRKLFHSSIEAVQKEVEKKIDLFNS